MRWPWIREARLIEPTGEWRSRRSAGRYALPAGNEPAGMMC